MAVSQQGITDRAMRVASAAGIDPATSPIVDNGFVGEDTFRSAMREAVIANKFQRTFSLTLADGTVDIPDTVLIDQLSTASIVLDDDTLTSFEERFVNYRRAPFDQLNYAAVKGDQLLFREAGEDIDTFDGDIELTAIAMPDIPATITDPIEIPATLADRCVEILAKMIRGV